MYLYTHVYMSDYTLNTSMQMRNICILSQEYTLMSTTFCVVSRLGIPRFDCSDTVVMHVGEAWWCLFLLASPVLLSFFLTLVCSEKKNFSESLALNSSGI